MSKFHYKLLGILVLCMYIQTDTPANFMSKSAFATQPVLMTFTIWGKMQQNIFAEKTLSYCRKFNIVGWFKQDRKGTIKSVTGEAISSKKSLLYFKYFIIKPIPNNKKIFKYEYKFHTDKG